MHVTREEEDTCLQKMSVSCMCHMRRRIHACDTWGGGYMPPEDERIMHVSYEEEDTCM